VTGASTALADGSVEAWGMGGAYTAACRGLGAVGWNPANLVLDDGLAIGLVSAAMDMHNNSLSLYRYNEINGGNLTDEDKQWVLDSIPEDGLRIDAEVRASGLGFRTGPFAITVQALGGGTGNLDKDFFDLVLMGNEVGESVSFDDTYGEGYALGAVTFSYAQPVWNTMWGRLSAGVNLRYCRGLAEMHVEKASGLLTTTFTEIRGAAEVSMVTATGGRGYGADLGLTLQAPRDWVFGLVFDNLVSSMTWDGDPERHIFRVSADSINILQEDMDAAISENDTTMSIEAYRRNLPRRLRLGASNQLGSWLIAVDVTQGLESRAGVSTTPALNAGTEWRGLGWVLPRAGFSFGGNDRSSVAIGLGLSFGPWRLDLAAVNRGALIPGDSKGVAVAAGSSLEF
jgi:hypothetical protein